MSSSQSGDLSAGGSGISPIGGIVVQEVGQMQLMPEFVPRRLVLLNYTLAALNDDGSKLLLGEIRTRGGDEWVLAGRSVAVIGGPEKRYLDLAIVPNIQSQGGGASIIFLVEKKNKDRCLVAHNIR